VSPWVDVRRRALTRVDVRWRSNQTHLKSCEHSRTARQRALTCGMTQKSKPVWFLRRFRRNMPHHDVRRDAAFLTHVDMRYVNGPLGCCCLRGTQAKNVLAYSLEWHIFSIQFLLTCRILLATVLRHWLVYMPDIYRLFQFALVKMSVLNSSAACNWIKHRYDTIGLRYEMWMFNVPSRTDKLSA